MAFRQYARARAGERRPVTTTNKTDDVRASHPGGRSITDLARDHNVSCSGIRTAVADLLPERVTLTFLPVGGLKDPGALATSLWILPPPA